MKFDWGEFFIGAIMFMIATAYIFKLGVFA
jgi:hypothetical protein